MTRPTIKTLALAIPALVLLAAAVACEIDHRNYPKQLAGLTPVRVPMSTSEPVRASFPAVWSERHCVALVFPPNVDQEMAALLRRASDSMGSRNVAVSFDFDWQVHEGGVEVA